MPADGGEYGAGVGLEQTGDEGVGMLSYEAVRGEPASRAIDYCRPSSWSRAVSSSSALRRRASVWCL